MTFRLSSVLRIKFHPILLEDSFMRLVECNVFNFKRLETLGHSFLKLSAAGYSYHTESKCDITKWHKHRENLMSISNLAKLGKEYGIDRMMCTTDWTESKFVPKHEKKITNNCYDFEKQLALFVKALTGAHLIWHGHNAARNFMNAIKLDVVTRKPIIPEPNQGDANIIKKIYQEKDFHELEKQIQYPFKNQSFLIQAFTHHSYKHSSIIGTFKGLEFYGDAVLDYLITYYLFDQKIAYNHDELKDLRASIVNNDALAQFASEISLDSYFLCPLKTFFNNRKKYANLFESLAGAVYLDSEMSLSKTKKVFLNLLGSSIDKAIRGNIYKPMQELMDNHNVRQVIHGFNDNYFTADVFIDEIETPFTGYGTSILRAEASAAKEWQKENKKSGKPNQQNIGKSND